jgi:hypothetical protein
MNSKCGVRCESFIGEVKHIEILVCTFKRNTGLYFSTLCPHAFILFYFIFGGTVV